MFFYRCLYLCTSAMNAFIWGGEPFIPMVEQLPPHLHTAGGDIQAGQCSGGKGILHDVLGQEGEPHAVLDHLAEQGSTAQLEEGLDGQLLRRHALVEGIAVAHAPLGQQEFLARPVPEA